MKPKQQLLTASFVALLALTGCGSDPKIMVSGTTSISKGTELTDLQAALAAGAITQAEYDKLRTVILNRPN
jgi:uncharacterized protein YcfL